MSAWAFPGRDSEGDWRIGLDLAAEVLEKVPKDSKGDVLDLFEFEVRRRSGEWLAEVDFAGNEVDGWLPGVGFGVALF